MNTALPTRTLPLLLGLTLVPGVLSAQNLLLQNVGGEIGYQASYEIHQIGGSPSNAIDGFTAFVIGNPGFSAIESLAYGDYGFDPSNKQGSRYLRANNAYLETRASDRAVVTAGSSYTFTVLVADWQNGFARDFEYVFGFFDGDTTGAALLPGSVSATATTIARSDSTDPFTVVTATLVAPVGATHAGIRIGAPGDWLYTDDFSITAVPEPSSAAVLAGFGALGAVALQRRQRR